MITLVSIIFFIGYLQEGSAYREVSLTEGRAIVANDTKFINFDGLRVRKVNKTHHLLLGTVNVNRDIDDEFRLEMRIYKKAGNVYQKTAFHIGPKKACLFIKEAHYAYPALLEVSDFPKSRECPLKQKLYHINGMDVPMETFPVNLDGDFMFELRLLDDDETILNGFQFYASFIFIGEEKN